MNQYIMCVAVQDGELEKIFERLDAAQEEIRKCYDDLARLGVLEIKKPLDKASGRKGLLSLFEFVNKRIQEFCSLAD